MRHGDAHLTRFLRKWTHDYSCHAQRRGLLTLAIETSCDDTCVAILSKNRAKNGVGKRINGALSTQVLFHQKITAKNTGSGGIHPIEALDSHRSNLAKLIERSLKYLPELVTNDLSHRGIFHIDGTRKQKPDFISVTRGPGMRSNLSCGLDTAKGLATAWQIPLVGVHHMQAHALTPRLVYAMGENDQEKERDSTTVSAPKPEFPFLTLLVSGGHTMLLHSKSLLEHSIIANSVDIAIGDALDKCGRLILPKAITQATTDTAYAKHLSQYAFPSTSDFQACPIPVRRGDEMSKPPNQFGWQIQTPFAETRDLAFSFSSLPSRVGSLLASRQSISEEERITFARTILTVAFEHLGSRTIIALEDLRSRRIGVPTLVVSGGVAANDFLRYFLRRMLSSRGFENVELVFPPIELCTDNAAMIAWAGMEMYEAGFRSDLSCPAERKWSMDSKATDGGIIGVGGWERVSGI